MARTGHKLNRISVTPEVVQLVMEKVALDKSDEDVFYVIGRNAGQMMGQRAWFGTTQLSYSTVKQILQHKKYGFYVGANGMVELAASDGSFLKQKEAFSSPYIDDLPQENIRRIAEVLIQCSVPMHFSATFGDPMQRYITSTLLTSELADLFQIPLATINCVLKPTENGWKGKHRGHAANGVEVYDVGMKHSTARAIRRGICCPQLKEVWNIVDAMQRRDGSCSKQVWSRIVQEPLTQERIAEDKDQLLFKRALWNMNMHVERPPQYRLLDGSWHLELPQWEEDHFLETNEHGQYLEYR